MMSWPLCSGGHYNCSLQVNSVPFNSGFLPSVSHGLGVATTFLLLTIQRLRIILQQNKMSDFRKATSEQKALV